jgi:hypothetical protein
VIRRKQMFLAYEGRAKATQLGTMLACAQSPESKARMLTRALEWDDRAAAHDAVT